MAIALSIGKGTWLIGTGRPSAEAKLATSSSNERSSGPTTSIVRPPDSTGLGPATSS
jgi:hypothetical protein